jgi:hypothetical protein
MVLFPVCGASRVLLAPLRGCTVRVRDACNRSANLCARLLSRCRASMLPCLHMYVVGVAYGFRSGVPVPVAGRACQRRGRAANQSRRCRTPRKVTERFSKSRFSIVGQLTGLAPGSDPGRPDLQRASTENPRASGAGAAPREALSENRKATSAICNEHTAPKGGDPSA